VGLLFRYPGRPVAATGLPGSKSIIVPSRCYYLPFRKLMENQGLIMKNETPKAVLFLPREKKLSFK
jgi:hypothetical protein